MFIFNECNITCPIPENDPFDDITWLVMKDAAPSQNIVMTKSSKPHSTVKFGYTVNKRSTFLMLQFPQLFFHLKPETNVILSPIFRRMNKHPLLELQSQLKLLGHFAVFLRSQCWCARFGEFTAINKIERTRRQARSKKTALGGSIWTIFVWDCSSPLSTQKNWDIFGRYSNISLPLVLLNTTVIFCGISIFFYNVYPFLLLSTFF